MKTTITVTAPGGDHYTVTVEDDDGSSVFEVTATADDLARYAPDARTEALVEASLRFLLDREPRHAILGRFALPVIARYFPEYPDRIGEYLTPGTDHAPV